eukprot:jgi/Botrbrau1/6289/Bobra.0129s0032.1
MTLRSDRDRAVLQSLTQPGASDWLLALPVPHLQQPMPLSRNRYAAFTVDSANALQAAPPAGQSTAARSCLPGAFLLSPARDHPLPRGPDVQSNVWSDHRPNSASAATSLRIKLDIVIRIGPILRGLPPRSDLGPFYQ